MKSKLGRGGGFRGVLEYAFQPEKEPQIVSSTMSSATPRGLAQEFGVARRLRPDIKKPVFHAALALPKNDHATAEQWDQIARSYLRKMGFPDDTQYVAIRHSDTDHDHIHIIASRVSLDAAVWHGKWDVYKSIQVCQEIEREMGLTITPGLDEDGPKRERTASKGEIEMALHSGGDLPRQVLQETISAVLDELDSPISVPEFAATLELVGVGVQARMSPGGQLQGLSFEYDGVAFAGRKLGADYGWQALQQRGVEYDQGRDFEAMQPYIKEGTTDPREVLKEVLGQVLDELDGPISAVEFCERVQAAGVEVEANLANTGRLNGFSFGVGGDWFSGSKINKRFGWSQLKKEGIEYEQDGHFEQLKRFSTRFRDAELAADQGVERETGLNAGAVEQPVAAPEPAVATDAVPGPDAGRPVDPVAAVPGREPGQPDRAVDELAADGAAGADELRPSDRSPAPDAGRSDTVPAAADGPAAGRDGQVDKPVAATVAADREATSGLEPANEVATAGAGAATAEQPAVERPSAESPAPVVETGSSSGSSRSTGGSGSGDWASRFKRASAAKRSAKRSADDARNMARSNTGRARFDESDIASSRAIDPTQYLLSMGFGVKREGRHLSVYQGKDEAYRITRKADGHWVACDHYGNGVGDNIALVQEIERNAGFAEAVYKLTGAPPVDITNKSNVDRNNNANADRQPPRLPIMSPTDREPGRLYLRDRGISQQTIEAAEACGMVRYTRGAVLFVGTDAAGTVQNVTRRATDPADPVQKRDLKGSDKQYPPVLPGHDGNNTVWVVEGGADALAVHDLYARQGKPAPTVVVSSGANVLSWADNPEVQQLLQGRTVVLAEEREKDADAQQRADNGHSKQREALEALGCTVQGWKPREGYKDLADYNERRGDVERQRELEREQRQQMRQERGHSGPELG